jgi:ABC-type Fe3+/spermidine/putrescine transport system ATPase subunit
MQQTFSQVPEPGTLGLLGLGVLGVLSYRWRRGRAGARLAPGPVEILIRPERMSVVTGTTPREPDMITVTMKVVAVTHFGDSTLVTGSAGSQSLRVRVPASAGAAARAGDEVLIGWRVDDMHVIVPPSG